MSARLFHPRHHGVLLVAAALFLVGCSTPDPGVALCKQYAEAVVRCEPAKPGVPPSVGLMAVRADQRRSSYLAWGCLSRLRGPRQLRDMVQCAEETDDCAVFTSCSEKAADGIDAARLSALVDRGETEAVTSLCRVRPELAACRDSKLKLVKGMVDKTLVALRDAKGTGAESAAACLRVKAILRGIDKPPEKVVEAVNRRCKEAIVASRIGEVLVQVVEFKRRGGKALPKRCRAVLVELGRISGSDWATDAKALVAGACYGDLGARVLEKRLATATKCDKVLRELVDAVRTYKLQEHKALKPLYRSAVELCPRLGAATRPGRSGTVAPRARRQARPGEKRAKRPKSRSWARTPRAKLKAPSRPASRGASSRRGTGSRAPTKRGRGASRRR